MDHFTYDYIKAYHAEINRYITDGRIPRRISYRIPHLWLRFLNCLGDNLIALGKKIKYEISCTEFSQSQA